VLTGASGSSYVRFLAIGSLCIPAMNLEDGPAASAADGQRHPAAAPSIWSCTGAANQSWVQP
jgi:beta-glucosidase